MEPSFSPWKAKGKATPRRWLSQYTQCSPSAPSEGGKKKRRGGAHSDVFIVRSARQRAPDEKRRLYAIKRQALISEDAKMRAVREQKIAEELKKLVYRSMCGNFVLMHDWNSCETYVEPSFAKDEARNNMGWLGTPTKSPAPRRSAPPSKDFDSPEKYEFMHFVLEYGEKTLANCLKELNLTQYREVLWQVLYALHVAGKTFSFTHYDLHHKNILMCTLPMERGCYVYYHKGVAHYNQTCIVKIADFGLSRITTEEGEALFNTKIACRQAYSPSVDVMSVVGWPWKNLDPHKDQDPNHKELASLQKLMRKGVGPAALLNHRFFAPLKEIPASFSAERCVAVSAEGLDGIPKELHARALATCAPPTPSAGRSSSASRTSSPSTGSPGGFAVPASPYHKAGPSGLRQSSRPMKPPQPFSPSTTAKLADEDEPVDLGEKGSALLKDEPAAKKLRPNEPTTPRASESLQQEGPRIVRLAKRKRPPLLSFAAVDEEDKENNPNGSNVGATAAKRGKREALDTRAAGRADEKEQPRRSVRAKKSVRTFSPSNRKALSARRMARR